MTAPVVIIGVDPGGAETGIVTRRGDQLLGHTVIRRRGRSLGDLTGYLHQIVTAAVDNPPDNLVDWNHLDGDLDFSDLCWPAVAVEDVNEPSPHVRITNIRGLLDTAAVLGAVLLRHPDAVVVPPGRHGAGPLAAYPAPLRPARGQGRGHDRLRHCRSAWDVAGAAATLLRMRQAEVTPKGGGA